MRYAYVTGLVGFRVSERMRSPLAIKAGLFLTNNPEHVAAYVNTSHLVTIGTLEARLLSNGSPVLYKIGDVKRPEDAHVEVINFLREAQCFLTATWLHEDNGANCELGFAFGQEILHVHSNALALNYTDHTGSRKPLEVTLDKARELAEMHGLLFEGLREENRPKHTAFQKSINRLDRAMRFLTQARSSDDIGQKIANYCSFFESLLSTSSAELSHQLSERTAFFLADSPSERLRIFRDVKKAYGIRSKIVHGDVLSPSAILGLVDAARTCDEIARALVIKITSSPDLAQLMNERPNDALDAYMLDLIFGIRASSKGGEGAGDA